MHVTISIQIESVKDVQHWAQQGDVVAIEDYERPEGLPDFEEFPEKIPNIWNKINYLCKVGEWREVMEIEHFLRSTRCASHRIAYLNHVLGQQPLRHPVRDALAAARMVGLVPVSGETFTHNGVMYHCTEK